MEAVRLSHEGWDVMIDVENGALFRSCVYQDHDVLRPLIEPEDGRGFMPFLSGHFSLFPFSNRIANGSFTFKGQLINLPCNAPGQELPLHGHGLNAAWDFDTYLEGGLVLSYDHSASEWPWDYLARQTVKLAGNVLRLELDVTNKSQSTMPCGVGFHPYFSNPTGATLSFTSEGVWLPDDKTLPKDWVPISPEFDFYNARSLKGLTLDHCFTGIDRVARIHWPKKNKRLELQYSKNLKWAAVYIAKRDNCFCFEPVSHAHNALNMKNPEDNGLVLLEPGGTMSAWLEIKVN